MPLHLSHVLLLYLGGIARSLTPGWKFVLEAIWQGGQTVGVIFESGTDGKRSLVCYCST